MHLFFERVPSKPGSPTRFFHPLFFRVSTVKKRFDRLFCTTTERERLIPIRSNRVNCYYSLR